MSRILAPEPIDTRSAFCLASGWAVLAAHQGANHEMVEALRRLARYIERDATLRRRNRRISLAVDAFRLRDLDRARDLLRGISSDVGFALMKSVPEASDVAAFYRHAEDLRARGRDPRLRGRCSRPAA